MIARISGTVLAWKPPVLLLEVGSIAVEVHVASADWSEPEPGSSQSLHIHMVIRDDAWLLYGFVSEEHRRMFRMLIKLNTIGPAKALAILSHLGLAELCHAIRSGDHHRLSVLPGIGKRIAERLVLDLRERVSDFRLPGGATPIDSASLEDAANALKSLGYSGRDARRAVEQVYANGLDSGELVRRALQELGGGG